MLPQAANESSFDHSVPYLLPSTSTSTMKRLVSPRSRPSQRGREQEAHGKAKGGKEKGRGKQGQFTTREQQQEWQQHLDANPHDIYVRAHQIGPYGANRQPLPPPSEEPPREEETEAQFQRRLALCDVSDGSESDDEKQMQQRLQQLQDETKRAQLQQNELRMRKEEKKKRLAQEEKANRVAGLQQEVGVSEEQLGRAQKSQRSDDRRRAKLAATPGNALAPHPEVTPVQSTSANRGAPLPDRVTTAPAKMPPEGFKAPPSRQVQTFSQRQYNLAWAASIVPAKKAPPQDAFEAPRSKNIPKMVPPKGPPPVLAKMSQPEGLNAPPKMPPPPPAQIDLRPPP